MHIKVVYEGALLELQRRARQKVGWLMLKHLKESAANERALDGDSQRRNPEPPTKEAKGE